MIILKLEDAETNQFGDGSGYWKWPLHNIMLTQHETGESPNNFVTSLYVKHGEISDTIPDWSCYSWPPLNEIWDELTDILLEYDFLLLPLELNSHRLPLPDNTTGLGI